MKTCHNCGAQVEDSSKFCIECGANLEQGSDVETTSKDAGQTRVLDYSEQKTLESTPVSQEPPSAADKVNLADDKTSVFQAAPDAQQRVYLNQNQPTAPASSASSASSATGKKDRKKLIIAGCIAGGVVLIAIIALIIFFVFFQPNNSESQTETQTSVTTSETQEESNEAQVAENSSDKTTSSSSSSQSASTTPAVVRLSAAEIMSRPTFTMPFDTASASSVLPTSSYGTYYPSNVMDNDVSTAWVEGADGNGVGSTITLSNSDGSSVSFNQFCLNNGYGKSKDLFVYNARPSQVTLIIDGQERYSISLKDTDYFQGVNLPETVTCKKLTIRIDSVYAGSRYEDCCISDISLNHF